LFAAQCYKINRKPAGFGHRFAEALVQTMLLCQSDFEIYGHQPGGCEAMNRKEAVAGQFYPDNKNQLEAMVKRLMRPASAPKPAFMAMVPHAGYIYSGSLCGQVLGAIEIPARVLLLGPNHRANAAAPAALAEYQAWQTPLGLVEADRQLADLLLAGSPLFALDNRAHVREHSLEVVLPFLQTARPGVKICALSLGFLSLEDIEELGRSTAAAITGLGEPVLLVVSSDMNHYQPAERTLSLDNMALEQIMALDPGGLYQVVRKNGITMCGMLAAALGLRAALSLGARQAHLTGHSHSGMVTGDNSQVVGYAGLWVD
jgi:AmmeMemoRadiSam system protein B